MLSSIAARALAEQLLDLAQASDEVNMQMTARAAMGIAQYYQGHFVAVRVLIVLRNEEGLREHAVRLVALSEEGGFDQFRNQGLCAFGWLEARTGASQEGLDRLRNGLAGMLDLAVLVSLPFYRSLLVDAQSEDECRRDNIAALDEALELSWRTGDTWFIAELHRRRGEVLAGLSSGPTPAETEFHRALAIAREQSAKLFELRAAMSLARVWAKHGKRVEARSLLAPIYDYFTEGFATLDLQEARLLLDELANSPRRRPRRAY
jgi:predicted ATPase